MTACSFAGTSLSEPMPQAIFTMVDFSRTWTKIWNWTPAKVQRTARTSAGCGGRQECPFRVGGGAGQGARRGPVPDLSRHPGTDR